MKPVSVVCVSLAVIFSTSCSLNYKKEVDAKETIPEFVFTNTKFTRYEDNQKSMEMRSEKLEQYKNDSSSFARNSSFSTWDSNGTIQTEGSCGLLGINKKKEIYSLLDDIKIKNSDPKMEIIADHLKWDAKTEQLSSDINEYVTISQDDVELTGRGFSASGISNIFSFQSEVSGTIDQSNEVENTSVSNDSEGIKE